MKGFVKPNAQISLAPVGRAHPSTFDILLLACVGKTRADCIWPSQDLLLRVTRLTA